MIHLCLFIIVLHSLSVIRHRITSENSVHALCISRWKMQSIAESNLLKLYPLNIGGSSWIMIFYMLEASSEDCINDALQHKDVKSNVENLSP